MQIICARVITLLVLVLTTTACVAPKTIETSSQNVEPYVENYVQRFVQEAAAYNRNLPDLQYLHVVFVPSFSDVGFAATCTRHYKRPTIQISKQYWYSKSDTEKEIIMFHELGHCLLYRDHNETVLNSVPVSIMFPVQLYNIVYEPRREAYLYELFTKQ